MQTNWLEKKGRLTSSITLNSSFPNRIIYSIYYRSKVKQNVTIWHYWPMQKQTWANLCVFAAKENHWIMGKYKTQAQAFGKVQFCKLNIQLGSSLKSKFSAKLRRLSMYFFLLEKSSNNRLNNSGNHVWRAAFVVFFTVLFISS